MAPEVTPPSVFLMTKFHKFFLSLLHSSSPEVQVLTRISARDIRTNLGANLKAIQEETGLDPWLYGGQRLKKELLKSNINQVPESDIWRLGYLKKLLIRRAYAYYNGSDEITEIENLIISLVST